jgi:hypothetical protein
VSPQSASVSSLHSHLEIADLGIPGQKQPFQLVVVREVGGRPWRSIMGRLRGALIAITPPPVPRQPPLVPSDGARLPPPRC